MCHLVLALPILALVVFWIWPLWIAVPIYVAVAALSGLIYAKMMQVMRRPAESGVGELLHSEGEVVALDGSDIRVLVHGEHWSASSPDSMQVGDRVRVTGLAGMTLTVRRSGPGFHSRRRTEAQQGDASRAFTTST